MGRITEGVLAQSTRPGSKCGIGRVLAEYDAEDAAELAALIASAPDAVSYSAITRYLKSEAGGAYPIGNNTVSRHHAGECSCRGTHR